MYCSECAMSLRSRCLKKPRIAARRLQFKIAQQTSEGIRGSAHGESRSVAAHEQRW
jgi:hypothetical protein